MGHTTETGFQKKIAISKNRTAVQNESVENSCDEKLENYIQPPQQVDANEKAKLCLTAKRDDEENIVSRRQETD